MYWLIEIRSERGYIDTYRIVASSPYKHELQKIGTNTFIVEAPDNHTHWIAELYADGGIKRDYTLSTDIPEGWEYLVGDGFNIVCGKKIGISLKLQICDPDRGSCVNV